MRARRLKKYHAHMQAGNTITNRRAYAGRPVRRRQVRQYHKETGDDKNLVP